MPTTAEQQLALELINRARLDPAGEFDEYIVNGRGVTPAIDFALQSFNVDLDVLRDQLNSYDAVAPLAFNDALASSALTHTELMVQYDEQSHNLPGEPGLGQRINDAGYTGFRAVAESIFAYAQDIDYAHAAFYIDWGNGPNGIQDPAGHREATLNATFQEVGIAWVEDERGNASSVGPYLTTQHYGSARGYEAQALGVVFDDLDSDDFYDIGEGRGGVTITFEGGGETYVTTSWASGGYQIVLPDGIYDVTFAGGGMDGTVTTTVTMGGENIKVDAQFDDADPGLILTGTAGDDALVGGAGNDEISSRQGDDEIRAQGGDDDVRGGWGDDLIFGGSGNDFLRGGNDVDTIYGEDGADTLSGQRHGDTLYGGDGDDRVFGGGGNDVLHGGTGSDFLKGGSRKDGLYGGAGNDRLSGNSFDDVLVGGGGDDRLNGGGDDDRLTGSTGNDWMRGGTGADVFVFDLGHDVDIVDDFDVSLDRLEISTALANGASARSIVDDATRDGSGNTVLDFGNGDRITLSNVTDLSQLAEAIDIV